MLLRVLFGQKGGQFNIIKYNLFWIYKVIKITGTLYVPRWPAQIIERGHDKINLSYLMKILIATPLYPPDIAEPAPYVKEVAKRLAGSHEVTIVTYGRLPEKVRGARIVAIDKYRPLPIRLIAYTLALWRAARKADIIYAQNGASVELPAGLVALLSRRPLIFRIGDKVAHEHAAKNSLLRSIERFAMRRARKIQEGAPKKRPVIFPFEETPKTEWDEYNKSWDVHLKELQNIFEHA